MRTVRVFPAIFTVLSLSFAVPALAQTRPAPPPSRATTGEGIGIGALGGIAWSTIKGDSDTNGAVETRNGFLAGIWFGGNRNGRVGFLGEVDYVMKGANESGGPGELKLSYLEIPAVFRINLGGLREGARFYALAGPVVDITLKATLAESGVSLDVTDDYNNFDFGVLVGAGVEVRRIGVEVRGNWGMLAIFDPGEGEKSSKNFSLQVVGKFRFN